MHRKASRKSHSTNGVNIESRVTYNAVWKHWFQSVRACPYSWATGRNRYNIKLC